MRVFLDTNVLVSAFATRGLCADVLRRVLHEEELIVGKVVLRELRRVLRDKLKVPPAQIDAVEQLLREHEVVPKPRKPAPLALRDADDKWIVASAVAGRADVLVTGDRDLLAAAAEAPLPVLDPRGFWALLQQSRRARGRAQAAPNTRRQESQEEDEP